VDHCNSHPVIAGNFPPKGQSGGRTKPSKVTEPIEGVFIRALCFLGECSSDSWMYVLEQKSVSNRTRVEILASILKVAGHRTLKTHIMYKANLSYRQLQRYLNFLETNGMLVRMLDDDVLMFQITEKGTEFLRDYERISIYLNGAPSSAPNAFH
jgi:predicted transcriptional regulator